MRWLPFLSILAILIFIGNGITGSYKESAHGNSDYGVNRDVTELSDYARGNCAHCHEMHASVEGSEPKPAGIGSFALFADNFNTAKTTGPYEQSDNFCFYCHCGDNCTTLIQQVYNYDYSHTFGGDTSLTPSSILNAFNQASYHNLYDIWDFAKNKFSPSSPSGFFTSGSNPCVACHNPHIAQRSCGLGGNGTSFDPTQSAISKPSDHGNLWGNDDTERMDDYAAGYTYQAPYYDSNSSYEPAGDTIYDGSNMPDYVTFCTDCHNTSNQLPSHILGSISIPPRDSGAGVRYIDWDNEKHGKGAADGSVSLKNPYSNASGNKVVSCLDCHEPHGAPNAVLIRREVNDSLLGDTIPLDGAIATESSYCPSYPTYSGNKTLGYLCRQCHKDDYAFDNDTSHKNRWCIIHHNNSKKCGYSSSEVDDAPYVPDQCSECHQSKQPITCTCCHYHNAQNVHDFTGRTF